MLKVKTHFHNDDAHTTGFVIAELLNSSSHSLICRTREMRQTSRTNPETRVRLASRFKTAVIISRFCDLTVAEETLHTGKWSLFDHTTLFSSLENSMCDFTGTSVCEPLRATNMSSNTSVPMNVHFCRSRHAREGLLHVPRIPVDATSGRIRAEVVLAHRARAQHRRVDAHARNPGLQHGDARRGAPPDGVRGRGNSAAARGTASWRETHYAGAMFYEGCVYEGDLCVGGAGREVQGAANRGRVSRGLCVE